jgi:hypothetical protein
MNSARIYYTRTNKMQCLVLGHTVIQSLLFSASKILFFFFFQFSASKIPSQHQPQDAFIQQPKDNWF